MFPPFYTKKQKLISNHLVKSKNKKGYVVPTGEVVYTNVY